MNIENLLTSWSPAFFTVLISYGLYRAIQYILVRQTRGQSDKSLIRSIILFIVAMVGIIAVLLAIPMSDSLRGQITSLIGIVISAVLALSSATFIGNALAGIMLRLVSGYKNGDFIHVNDVFGRVTERGLFHTEIQTETRDLMTLPNMFLATNPVRVTRASGTFIEGSVSLGYDVNQNVIKEAMVRAATDIGLEDSFVRITELGDYSVTYKVYGLLKDAKTILTAKSRLNSYLLDSLHAAGIEIVSPSFMNQRQIGDTVFIPQVNNVRNLRRTEAHEDKAEQLIFDKAEEAETIEKNKNQVSEIESEIKEVDTLLKTATEEEKQALQDRRERLLESKDNILSIITEKLDQIDNA